MVCHGCMQLLQNNRTDTIMIRPLKGESKWVSIWPQRHLGSAKVSPHEMFHCEIQISWIALLCFELLQTQPNLVQIPIRLRWVNFEQITLYIWFSVALNMLIRVAFTTHPIAPSLTCHAMPLLGAMKRLQNHLFGLMMNSVGGVWATLFQMYSAPT